MEPLVLSHSTSREFNSHNILTHAKKAPESRVKSVRQGLNSCAWRANSRARRVNSPPPPPRTWAPRRRRRTSSR
eukprot:8711354-Pyramimonas_sp.AAC.1